MKYKNGKEKINYFFYYIQNFFIKVHLKAIIKKYIAEVFSDIFILIPFIPRKIRFLKCSTRSIYKLNDKKVKYSFLGNDKGDLANFMLKDFDIYKNNNDFLRKIAYSISYRRYSHSSLKKLIEILEKGSYSANDYKRFILYLAYPFGGYGDVESYEKLLIYMKVKLDNLYSRKIGQYNESIHMTAIGHMSNLPYVFKAIENKIIDLSKSKFRIIIAKPFEDAKQNCIANNEYAKILIDKAKTLGLEVVFSNKCYIDLEPDLELWPNTFLNKYSFHRHIWCFSNLFWEKNNYQKKIIWPFPYQIDLAKKIILKNFGQIPLSFVGIHMRTSKDDETLRNGNPHIFQKAIDLVNKAGMYCFLIGQNSNYSCMKNKKNVFDTTNLKLSKYERECLQIYIWSHSRFFIGSNSGGSEPAGTFDVPTIWLDCFPAFNNRGRSVKDHILPKRIYSTNLGRFLKLDELLDNSFWESQPMHEDPLHFKDKGYKLYSCKLDELEKSINDMISQCEKSLQKANQNIKDISISKLRKVDFEKYKYSGTFYY